MKIWANQEKRTSDDFLFFKKIEIKESKDEIPCLQHITSIDKKTRL